MSIISDITGAIKLLVDVYNSIRGVKKDSLDSNKKIFSPKALEDTHHHLKYLLTSIRNLESSIQREDKDSIQKEYSDFIYNLSHLLIRIQGINVNLIEIYSPGLGHKMAAAFGADSIIYSYFERQTLPTVDIDVKNSSKAKKHLLKVNEEFERLDMFKHWHSKEKIPKNNQEFMDILHELQESVLQINLTLEEFMKTNWSPKDLS
jgi:hypothetical protein